MNAKRSELLDTYCLVKTGEEKLLIRDRLLFDMFGISVSAGKGTRKKAMKNPEFCRRLEKAEQESRVLACLARKTVLQSSTLRPEFLMLEKKCGEQTLRSPRDVMLSYLSSLNRRLLWDEQTALRAERGEELEPVREELRKEIRELFASHLEVWCEQLKEEILQGFAREPFTACDPSIRRPFSLERAESMIQKYEGSFSVRRLVARRYPQGKAESFLSREARKIDPELCDRVDTYLKKGVQTEAHRHVRYLEKLLESRLTGQEILEAARQNPKQGSQLRQAYQLREKNIRIQNHLLEAIPEHYPDLYPLTRQMKRHFYLHIGPTNSAKTHDAMQRVREVAGQGGEATYLAPLRLLAYEQFQRLNEEGFPCTLLTGEEEVQVPFSSIQSSTIEMANMQKVYDIAVIDECQMIADRERGGAWSEAVLGLMASEIHMCAAPEAEDILTAIVRSCGDDLEIVRHERLTPLVVESQPFHFPRDLMPGDAVIVFSRRDVHAVAADIQKHFSNRMKPSIIYGALPHEVRHEEARKFAEGASQVVVATDAIGMGMNLPIRRVIMLEMNKFDGVERRTLLPEEIRQICGRAGRYGIYDTGYVNAEVGKAMIRSALEGAVHPITRAVIHFPETLLSVDTVLSDLLKRWISIDPGPGWDKGQEVHALKLTEYLDESRIDKQLEYRLVSIAFNEEEPQLLDIWKRLALAEQNGEHYPILREVPELVSGGGAEKLEYLEYDYRVCDLCFAYARGFLEDEEKLTATTLIAQRKAEISNAIIKILQHARLKGRTCRICGRPIPWSAGVNICTKCSSRRSWW